MTLTSIGPVIHKDLHRNSIKGCVPCNGIPVVSSLPSDESPRALICTWRRSCGGFAALRRMPSLDSKRFHRCKFAFRFHEA